MKATQYEKLDSLILARLTDRSETFTFLHTGDVRAECDRLDTEGHGDSFRILDRRLQALRKKCEVWHHSKEGWTIMPKSGGAA